MTTAEIATLVTDFIIKVRDAVDPDANIFRYPVIVFGGAIRDAIRSTPYKDIDVIIGSTDAFFMFTKGLRELGIRFTVEDTPSEYRIPSTVGRIKVEKFDITFTTQLVYPTVDFPCNGLWVDVREPHKLCTNGAYGYPLELCLNDIFSRRITITESLLKTLVNTNVQYKSIVAGNIFNHFRKMVLRGFSPHLDKNAKAFFDFVLKNELNCCKCIQCDRSLRDGGIVTRSGTYACNQWCLTEVLGDVNNETVAKEVEGAIHVNFKFFVDTAFLSDMIALCPSS